MRLCFPRYPLALARSLGYDVGRLKPSPWLPIGIGGRW